MARVPQSLDEAIEQEPQRFIKYFSVSRISQSSNPYKEFLRQFRRNFGNQQGLFLWNYILDNYPLTNRFYRLDLIQRKLPQKFQGDINKQIVLDFFEEYKHAKKIQQTKREDKIKKEVKVKGYNKVSSHNRKSPHKYSQIQQRFIVARKDASLNVLADEFNSFFKSTITKIGLRDKKLRLLGRKK